MWPPIRLKNGHKKPVWTHLTYKELDLIEADKCGILWYYSRASHICISFERKHPQLFQQLILYSEFNYNRPYLSEALYQYTFNGQVEKLIVNCF